MVRICNTVQPEFTGSSLGGWEKAYSDSDKLIASGSAYFAQAFADVLGLVSDEELNDLSRGRLRLLSADALLRRAIREYESAADFDSQTGLDEYHQTVLESAGYDENGTLSALLSATGDGTLSLNRELLEGIAELFVRRGYRELMQSYVARLHKIQALLREAIAHFDQKAGTTWMLLAAFTEALQVGQAIAVLNIRATSRLKVAPTAGDGE